MKRLLLIAFLGLSLIPELAHAQKRRGGRGGPQLPLGLTFGAKLGGSYSTFVGADATFLAQPQQFEGRVGPVGGGLVNFRFTQQLSVQVEALYAPRGATRFLGTGAARKETKFSFTYFDVPVLAKFNAKIFYLEAGVVPSFLLSGMEKKPDVPAITTTGVSGLDIGYGLGLGIEAPIGAIFGIRYVRSTSSIGQGGTLVGKQALENSSVQVTGGYIFNHVSSGRGRKRR